MRIVTGMRPCVPPETARESEVTVFRKIVFAVAVLSAAGLYAVKPNLFASLGGSLVAAIVVKDVTASAKKFSTRGAGAGADYTRGVQNAGQRWHDNTKASSDNYVQGVQQSIADGRFAKGVDKSGAQHYVDRASTKGANAFPTGIQAAEGRWAAAVTPFLQTLASATLPPRGPKGDPRNQARSAMVADILRKKKLAG